MRICLAIVLLALGGCGTSDAYDNARSLSEAFYHFDKNSGLKSDKAVGKNPYDNDPRYKMTYCQIGDLQHWSTVNACEEAKGKPLM